MKTAPKLTAVQTKGLEGLNVSNSIRFLNKAGYSRADIARSLNKRYQHVRNVLVEDQRKKS